MQIVSDQEGAQLQAMAEDGAPLTHRAALRLAIFHNSVLNGGDYERAMTAQQWGAFRDAIRAAAEQS